MFRLHPLYTTTLAMGATIAAAQWLRQTARRRVRGIATEPLSVQCPECEASFLLKDYSDALGHMDADEADAETQRWVKANTRPCPTCGTAIQKISGCNAMRCGSCRRSFCWACMRSSTACNHFSCRNGAPYGNARPQPNGLGWIQGNNQGLEQPGTVDHRGLLSPAEETAQRIGAQALHLMKFCAGSAALSLYTAFMSEAVLHQSGRLWSIWMTFFALPLKYLLYIAAIGVLFLAIRRGISEPHQLRGQVGNAMAVVVFASLVLLTNVAAWIAWVVTSLLQLPFFLGTVASVAGGTYWWFTQPKRLEKRRGYELAEPLCAADEARVRLFEAQANNGNFGIQFRTRHEMRDHMILAESRPWLFALHTALHFGFGQ